MQIVKLDDICEINIGKTPARKNKDYWGKGHKWVAISDMNSKFISKTKEQITDLAIDETKIKLVPKGTVIMSFKLSIGKVAIAAEPLYTNEAIAHFIPKVDNILPEYLYYVLQFVDYEPYINKAAKGKTLNKKTLKKVKIPIFDLKTQKKIVAVLDKVSNIIGFKKKQLQEIDYLIQSIFYEMFGDFKVQNHFQYKALGELATVRSSSRVFKKDFQDEGIPFFRGQEISALARGSFKQPELFITDELYYELKDKSGIPKLGDLLLPSIASEGQIWEVNTDKDFYFKDGRVLWISFTNEDIDLNTTYIKYALKDKLIRDYSNIASGTTFAELKIFALKETEIMFPPITLQNQFAMKVGETVQIKEKMQASLDEMNTLFDALMQKAFTGELA